MEKKIKFSDNPTVAKTVYGAIIALLCITAIIIGIVAANNRKKDNAPTEQPPVAMTAIRTAVQVTETATETETKTPLPQSLPLFPLSEVR